MTSEQLPAVDVLVVGGGNAGISLAARLKRQGADSVAIVEPKSVHTYRPLLNYAGAGLASPSEYRREQRSVMPDGVRWIRDSVTGIDPEARTVRLTSGGTVEYEQVVLCPGSTPDWATVPGSEQAMASEHASTNFVEELAPKTWELVRSLRSGRAVFTIPAGPAPCPQSGQKALYLACDHWQRTGVLDDIEVTLVTPTAGVTGIAAVDGHLREWVQRYGITVLSKSEVTAVDVGTRTLRVRTPGGEQVLPYDLLHHVPVHRAPAWIAEAGLATAEGSVDVDPHTLRHRTVDTVWACGDAADADCSRSGGALRHQTRVLAANLLAAREGRAATDRYDGYSVTPVTVARGRALVAEYDRGLHPSPTVPGLPLNRPRRAWWLFDRHVLPLQYWHSILKGR